MEFLSALLLIIGVFIGVLGAALLLFINEAVCNEQKADELIRALAEKTGQELTKEELYTELLKIKNATFIITIIGVALITIGTGIFLVL